MAVKGNTNVNSMGFWTRMKYEWTKAGNDLAEAFSPGKSKQTEAGKARAESAKIRGTNNVERLERLYPSPKPSKHADAGLMHDSVAFSPEALAMMG